MEKKKKFPINYENGHKVPDKYKDGNHTGIGYLTCIKFKSLDYKVELIINIIVVFCFDN